MGQPLKLSDGLVMDARIAGETMQRSIAGQVEFWARIGKAIEQVASRTQLERLQARVTLPLSGIVATIAKPAGRARFTDYLVSRPFPRFSAHPKLAKTFIREDEDGSRVVGRVKQGTCEPMVGVASPETSLDRVAQRVLEGGHDVPTDKLLSRDPRVMENFRLARLPLPLVLGLAAHAVAHAGHDRRGRMPDARRSVLIRTASRGTASCPGVRGSQAARGFRR
jgi:hypothetical protein